MNQTTILDETETLHRQIEALQAECGQHMLENEFLRRAAADLNFHHNAHEGIIYLNARHEIIYANPSFLEMMALDSSEQILNQPIPPYMWGNPSDEAALVRDIQDHGFVKERELAFYDQRGHPLFAVCSAVASRDEAGHYLGAEILLSDITAKRAAQAELEQQQDLLEALLTGSTGPILVLDAARQLVRTNPAGLSLFGLKAEALPQPFRSLLVKQGVPTPSIIELETKLLKNEVISQEIAVWDRHFSLQVVSLSTRQAGWICRLHDITARKQTEADLRATASRLTALLGNVRAGVLVEDAASRIVQVNQTFCDIFGIPAPPQTLIGVDYFTDAEEVKHLFVEPEKFTRRIEMLLRYQNNVTGEELRLVDGRVLERDYIPIFLDETYAGHLWQYRDITARKQAEHSLQAGQKYDRIVAENASNLIARVTPAGSFIYVSPACRTCLGYEPEELVGCSFYDFIHPDDLVEVRDLVPPLFDPANAPAVLTLRLIHKDKYDVWLELSVWTGRGPAQEETEFVMVAHDVTERKVYEAALQRAYDELEQRVAERTAALTRANRRLQQEITAYQQVEAALTNERDQLARRVAERTAESSAAHDELVLAGPDAGERATESDQRPLKAGPETNQSKRVAPHILLAEDDETNIFVISGYLQKQGYQVTVTRNGAEALARAKEEHPDLILMDVQMPEIDGLEAIRLLRADQTLGAVPVIALTTQAMPDDELCCLKAGADAYITKPVSLKRLVSAIEYQLDKHKPAGAR